VGDEQKLPSGQLVSDVDPAGQYDPDPHTANVDELVQYFPAGQISSAIDPTGQ
jgi:hypothetical protein